jgi:hypothetical protein
VSKLGWIFSLVLFSKLSPEYSVHTLKLYANFIQILVSVCYLVDLAVCLGEYNAFSEMLLICIYHNGVMIWPAKHQLGAVEPLFTKAQGRFIYQ